ncbi:unnamed protein product [marine sediment metagenome]|uniref:Uncharacterized protein n=1 Tax=marine sediment metagenome TaxID=412755 RepID=X0VNJ7_9ZZZZ
MLKGEVNRDGEWGTVSGGSASRGAALGGGADQGAAQRLLQRAATTQSCGREVGLCHRLNRLGGGSVPDKDTVNYPDRTLGLGQQVSHPSLER